MIQSNDKGWLHYTSPKGNTYKMKPQAGPLELLQECALSLEKAIERANWTEDKQIRRFKGRGQ